MVSLGLFGDVTDRNKLKDIYEVKLICMDQCVVYCA